MVGIVQLAEHWIVVPGVVGSSPITHPIKKADLRVCLFYGVPMGLEEGAPSEGWGKIESRRAISSPGESPMRRRRIFCQIVKSGKLKVES